MDVHFTHSVIIIRHQTLTWNWTITTYTQWFFGIKFAFLCLLHICRNACAKAELCKNNKNVLLWWKRINGILLPKFFWPNVRKNCSSDREKNLKFEAEGREFANFFRSLGQFIQTVKGQNKCWFVKQNYFLAYSCRFLKYIKLEKLKLKVEKNCWI